MSPILGFACLILTIDFITKIRILPTKQAEKQDNLRPADLIAIRPLTTSGPNVYIVQPRACWRLLRFAWDWAVVQRFRTRN